MILSIKIYLIEMEENYFDKIDDYLTGRLNPTEKLDFEKEMTSNFELKKEVDFSKSIMDAVNDDETELLREKLNQVRVNVQQKKKNIAYVWMAAASAAIIIGMSLIFLLNRPQSTDQLFIQYFQKFEIPSASRSAGESDTTSRLVDLYNSNKLKEALPEFEIMASKNRDGDLFHLMLVSIYLKMDMADKAQQDIEKLMSVQKSGMFNDTFQWYLGLALIKQRKVEDAIKVLNGLQNTDSKYALSAKELIASLEKLK